MKEILIKKPKQQRSKQKYQAVLQALPRVITQNGFDKTTTAAIACEAEISIGSLYDYFSCKEAIVTAYIDDALNNALQNVAYYAKHSALNWHSILKELVRTGIQLAEDHRTVLQIIFLRPDFLKSIDLIDSKNQIDEITIAFAKNTKLQVTHQQIDLMVYSMTNIILGFQFRIALMNDNSFSQEAITDELGLILTSYINQFTPNEALI